MVKILEYLEGLRKQKGLTRKELSERMGSNWSKEKVDKIFDDDAGCPRAETLAEMMEALGVPTFPSEWYRSKNGGKEDE